MTISLSLSQQIQHLSPLEKEEENYLPFSSSLIFFQTKNQIIYHGYHKPKPSQEAKGEGQSGNQQAKPKKKFVFKMGKDKEAPKANTEPTQKLHVFSIQTNSWSQLQAKGKLPNPRQNHQTLMLNANLFLMYGGKNLENDKILNDLHALNLQTLQWKKLFSIQGPPATENNTIIKVTQTKIALISFKQIWTFESKDVKWQLNTNELPGGVWQNHNIKFENLIESEKEIILGGICISADLASIKLLVFSCQRQRGIVSTFLVNLNEKEVSKIKMKEEIIVDPENIRNDVGCFEMGIDAVSEDSNQALLTIRTKSKNLCYLVDYHETTKSLNIISKAQTAIKNDELTHKVMGRCLDQEDSLYFIAFDPQNPKKKLLQKLQINLKQNVSQIISQVPSQKKLNTQPSGYMNSLSIMKTSEIQSIPQESNESSVIGMKSFQNQRLEEFEEIENENFIYQMRRTQKDKPIGSGPNSLVNRSPSALSDEIQSENQETDRHNQSMARRNDQSADEKSSYHNQSSVYISTRKPANQQDISNNNSSFPEQQHIQKTLQKILVYEHIKRTKLEEKSQFLEKAIQNTEQLAKLLTKFASSSQKLRHIEKVVACKQQLEAVWNKEVFYRKQINQNFIQTDSQILSRNQLGQNGGKSRSRELPRGKIDMGKLMQKHLIEDDEE